MLGFRREGRRGAIPPRAAFLASRVGGGWCHVRPRWRRSYCESERKGKSEGVLVRQGGEKTAPGRARGACTLASPRSSPIVPALVASSQVTAGPGPPRAAWGVRSARPALSRGARRPSPSPGPSRRFPSHPVPSLRVPPSGCLCESAALGTSFDFPAPIPAALPTPSRGRPLFRPQDAECD